MAKALKIGASIAAIAAVTVVTGGAALGLSLSLGTSAFGVTAGQLLAASAVLGSGSSLLSPKPKAPSDLSDTSSRLTVSINLREPRKIVLGSTAMPTDLRDQEWSDDQTYLHRFIVVASHRVQAIRQIWLDDKLAWTSTGGAQGEFKPWLQVTPVLEGSAANAINIGARMGGARRYTGCAYVYLRFQILAHSKKTDSVFAQSVPSRVTIVGDGAPVYDPRLDSTVPGGSGPQRANDQSTWAWSESAGRNPALGTLFYLLGWRINGRLAVGKGMPASRIDLASFITAANLCDEPVTRADGTTEPRYRCDGVLSEGDATDAVLDNLKASMNAVMDDVDGKLRIDVLHNDLATPAGDLGTADVLGAFTWMQTLPLSDSVNVIRGSYVDPSSTSLYQSADYPEVSLASPDGIERPQTVNFPLVQSASQAQRLVSQRLQRMQYGGTFTAEFQSTAWKYRKGDVIRLTFAPLGWDRKLFRIADMAIRVDGRVPMMLREENEALYAAFSAVAPVTAAAPTTYDPALWPLVQGIVDAGTTSTWDGVTGPGKPHDNADVTGDNTAKDTKAVSGRPAAQVVSDLDVALGDLLTEILRNATFRGETDQVVYLPDGTPVRTVVQVLSAMVDGNTAYIADLRQVDGNGNLKAAFVLNSQGHVTGVTQLNDGKTGSFYVVADEFGFVDPNGGNAVKPLYYVDGQLYLTDTKIDGDLVVSGTITTGKIAPGQVTSMMAVGFPDRAITSTAEVTIAEMAGLTIGDAADGKARLTIEADLDGTSSADAGIMLSAYVDTGSGYQLYRAKPQGIRVDGGSDARWVLPISMSALVFGSTVSVKFTAAATGIGGGGINSSYVRNIEVNVQAGYR